MKKIILYISVCTLLFSACSDYLDRDPLNNPSDGTFLVTETEMEMALAGCYTNLYRDFETMTFFMSFDQCSDIGYDRNASELQKMGQGSADATSALPKDYWSAFYTGIGKCNYLLTNMTRGQENVNAASYARIKAEAQFLRALYYSYLIELYGDVPLTKEPLTLETSQIPRTAKSEIVDFILNELTEAAAVLDSKNSPTSGRPSKGAALAIKARTALYNERWPDAIAAAKEVIAMEGTEYILEDDYSLLFKYDGQTSKEVIFSVQYLKSQKQHALYRLFGSRNGLGHSNKKPAYQLSDSWECTDGLAIDKSPLFNPKDPYKNRDPRLGYTLAVSGSEFLGYQFETHGDSLQCWNYRTEPATRVDNLEATHAYATFTGICWRKYANIEDKDDINNCDMNTILMRYAEVLLIYAEAKIRAGEIDQSVYDAINKVRQRPSVNMPALTTTNATELLHAVYRERKYEFSGEGLRLFDIRRWKIAEVVMNQPLLGRMKKSYPEKAPRIDAYATAYYDDIPVAEAGETADYKMRLVDKRTFRTDRDYLWPIPYIERQTNPELTQNPGWE